MLTQVSSFNHWSDTPSLKSNGFDLEELLDSSHENVITIGEWANGKKGKNLDAQWEGGVNQKP